MNEYSILSSAYNKLEKIGSGLTSTVYKASNKNHEQVCLKIIDSKFYSKPLGKLLIDNQISILKQLNHKNLLQFKQHIHEQKDNNSNIIVTQYCEGGNLYERMKKQKIFSEGEMVEIMCGVVSGLAELVQKNIIHRDLKPENVFFCNGSPVIADFGFAVHTNNKQLMKINAGSPLYMSPESLRSLDFSVQSDTFAMGVMMYEMLKGRTPWTAGSEKELLENICKKRPNIQLKNKQLQKLILKCLQPLKQKRAKFEQVYQLINQLQRKSQKKVGYLIDIKNKTPKQFQKPFFKLNLTMTDKNKQTKQSFKLTKSIGKGKQNKENLMNLSYQLSSELKTNRVINQAQHKRQHSVFDKQMDGLKTRRNKTEKVDNDFKAILTRLNPEKMKFLPSSMIEKFKFILSCYNDLINHKQSPSDSKTNPLPLILKEDKTIIQILSCRQQKQLCLSVNGYIGRMYRLAKNYNIQKQFMKDIEVLYHRVQSLCA